MRLDQNSSKCKGSWPGGEAKFSGATGGGQVNGDVELRRGRQLNPGRQGDVGATTWRFLPPPKLAIRSHW